MARASRRTSRSFYHRVSAPRGRPSIAVSSFSGGGSGPETDTVALAVIAGIQANAGKVLTPGRGVLATDTQVAYVNNTAGNITVTGTTGAALAADGLEAASGGPVRDVVAVTTVAQMTVDGDLYELTAQDGGATVGLYLVRDNGTPTQVQAF